MDSPEIPMSDERLQEIKAVLERTGTLLRAKGRECVAEIERLRASLQEKELRPVGHRKKDCLCRFCASPTTNLMDGTETEHPFIVQQRRRILELEAELARYRTVSTEGK